MKRGLFLLLFLAAAGTLSAQTKTMPSVTLTNLNGEKVNIQDLSKSGKVIVFDFWATWCIPCKKSLTNMMDVYEDWKKNYNVEIVAVSIDDAQNTTKVKTQVTGNGWPYLVLLDPNQEMKQALNFQNIPYSVLVDKNGNIVYTHQGYVDGDEQMMEEEIKKLSQK